MTGNSTPLAGWARRETTTPLSGDPPLRFDSDSFAAHLMDTVQDYSVVLLDPSGHVIRWNAGAAGMLGSQAEDAVGQHIGRWYPESHVHRGLLKAAFRQASLEGRHRYDGWRLRTDGVRFWASTALTAVHDLTGTLAGFGEMTYDLTDRLQVEDERVRQIREQVKRVKADLAGERIAGLLTSISDAFFVVDAAWRFTYVTPQAAPMLYRDQNVLVGQNLWSLFPSVEGTLFQRELRRAMERRTSVGFEARAFSNDRWIEVHAYPAADGLSIYLRDVTARKRQYAEREALTDQLADERARLETVLQQMPAGVIIAESPSGRLLLGNQQAERLLQQPIPLSATIDDPRVWQGTHVDGTPYPLEQQPLYRAATVGDVIAGEEVLYHRGDGTRVWLSMNAAPVRDRLGNIIAGVVAFYDITEQKRTRETQRFLAEASAILSSSLDYETTLHSVAQLAVPTLADWCTVNVLEEDGTVSRLAVVHHGEPPVPLVPNADADRIDAVDMQGNSAVARVLRDGQPLLYPEISEQLLASDINPRDLQVIKFTGAVSAMVLPLMAREHPLGVLTFLSSDSGRHYNADDLALAGDLAFRCAQAIDHARLYRQAQRAVQARSEFLSMAAHELKTPITGLRGFVQLTMRRLNREREVTTDRTLE